MKEDELRMILAAGRESRSVEFKRSTKFEDGFRAKIAATIIRAHLVSLKGCDVGRAHLGSIRGRQGCRYVPGLPSYENAC